MSFRGELRLDNTKTRTIVSGDLLLFNKSIDKDKACHVSAVIGVEFFEI